MSWIETSEESEEPEHCSGIEGLFNLCVRVNLTASVSLSDQQEL